MSAKKELKYFWFDSDRLRFSANTSFTVDRTPSKLFLRSYLSTIELVDVNNSIYAFVDDTPVGKINLMPNIPFVKKLIPKRYIRKSVEVLCSPETAREIIELCPDAKVHPDNNKRVKVVIPL
jgi:hypothetical protein